MQRLGVWLRTWGIPALWTGLLGGTAIQAYHDNGLLAVGVIVLDVIVWAAGLRAYRLWWTAHRPGRHS